MSYALRAERESLLSGWLDEMAPAWRPRSMFPPRLTYAVGLVTDQALADLRANDHDCEWLLVVTLPHEIIFWTGKFVPLWEGDVERIAWEAARARG